MAREKKILACIVIFLSPLLIFGGTQASKHYNAPLIGTDSPPKIDGVLNDRAWEKAEWETGFIQSIPYDGSIPSQQTSFKIIFNKDTLYAAIRAHDTSPEKIVHRVTRRDAPIDSDLVGIILDSYFDRRTCVQFAVTAAGIKHDVAFMDDNDKEGESNWDPIWDVKTSIDEAGWIAEMSIPFNQLRYKKTREQIWGLQVVRLLYRKQEWSTWQHISQDAPGWTSFFGKLSGLREIKISRQMELIPFGVLNLQNSGANNNERLSGHLNGGLDGKIGIYSNFTLDFSINPDFGQVEADPSVVNLTAFETRFEEKRPFFIEGMNILSFELPGSSAMEDTDLFYSRRIGRYPQIRPELSGDEYDSFPEKTTILGAFKLTGRTNSGYSIGILEALTAGEYALIMPDSEGSREELVEPLSNYFVIRIKKEDSQGNTSLGGIITATNRATSQGTDVLVKGAYTGGFDLNHRWNNKTYYFHFASAFSNIQGSEQSILRAQTAASRYFQRPDTTHLTIDPERTSLSGYGLSLSIGKRGSGRWIYNLRLNCRSPGLELNDLGYFRQADLIQEKLWLSYRIFNPFAIFRRIFFSAEQLARWNFAGEFLFHEGYFQIETQFVNYWSLQMRSYVRAKELSVSELRGGPSLLFPGSHNINYALSSDPRKKITFTVEGQSFWSHEGITYSHNIGIVSNIHAADNFSISLGSSYDEILNDLQWVAERYHLNEERYVFARLKQKELRFELRFNLSLTPELSIQFYGQPFISIGKFTHHKKITVPRAGEYHDRFREFSANEIKYTHESNTYDIDENMDGATDYCFPNPDFDIKEFKMNLVFRWEFKPGSSLYVVWSQNRFSEIHNRISSMRARFLDILNIPADNIFLIKISCWFSL